MNALESRIESPEESGRRLFLHLLHLRTWPEIPDLPPEDAVDIARVCALLSIRPTPGVSITRLLDISRDRLQGILYFLHANNCLDVDIEAPPPENPTSTSSPQGTIDSANGVNDAPPLSQNSFIAKIWQRFTAHK